MTDTAETIGVGIRVLGPLAAETEDGPAGLGGPRQRLVLALLVQAAPRAVAADRLIDDIWGEAPPSGAKATLQSYVSHLRSALGGGIETRSGGYALAVPAESVDAVRFAGLAAAGHQLLESDPGRAGEVLRDGLALWTGKPYADLVDEPALRAEITRLEELRLSALEDRIAADLAVGAHSDLVGELEVLTTEYALRERFRAQHMLALYRAGRQADALRAYRRTRETLVEELGIEPSTELRDLEERILRQDPSLAADLEPRVERKVILFTDLEDSTVLWELHPGHMPALVAGHDRILTEVVEAQNGSVFKTTGDGICAVFDRIIDAVAAASEMQKRLSTLDTGDVDHLAVRAAIDVGDVEARAADYYGPVLNRCARIMASGHGGQVLLSADAHVALAESGEAGVSTRSLGEFRFKGLGRPQHVHQLIITGLPDEFPPLRIDRLPPPLPGTAFGRTVRGYELREQVGAGDFGIVYRAYQPTVGREVAIKVVRPEYVDQPAFVRRFEAEAQLVAQLEHAHIVPLYDYWRDPDGAYLVFRWLRGGSLRKALDRGPFNPQAALSLLEQVGGALSYAHRHGVAHRDLKPGNVLLDESGDGYLTDFGIATRLVDASEAGRPYTNSPAYLAPEELLGQPVTTASDIYALGLVAFEIFSGRRPPMDGPLPAVHELHAVLPEALTAVISRATADDPAERFGTVDGFLGALRDALGESPAEEEAPFTPTRNPYKGLLPFTERDASDFYGRDALIADLVAAVGAHRLVAVVGPSGLGKSSAVRAGLIPALRAGGLPGSREWLVATMFPGTYPFEELEAALISVADDWPAHAADDLRRDERGLVQMSKQIIPDGTTLLLVIDQFEELFTLTRDEDTRRQFLSNLVEIVADERSRVRVVLTLRADHFDRPLRYPEFGDLIKPGLVTVVGLTDHELTDAILKPAHAVGISTEPGLANRILADLHDQPGALPLLQYALTELFASRHSDSLTTAGYEATGGLLGALSKRAEALYDGLDETGRQVARQVFLRLVNVGEERQDTRRRIRRTALEGLALDRTVLDHVLKAYGDHRLLFFDRDPVTRGPTIEVAHEALLSEWDRLDTWIDERRESLILHGRFTAAVEEWRAADQDPAYLLSGGRLVQFETWAESTDLTLTRSEQEYLQKSRHKDDEDRIRRRRRRRWIVGGFALAALIATILAVLAYAAQQDAQEQARIAQASADLARSRELAASAINVLDENPELSVLLALEATSGTDPPFESVAALHEALQKHRAVRTIYWPEGWDQGPGLFGLISPDGKYMVISGLRNRMGVWDLDADLAEPVWVFEVSHPDYAVILPYFSTDGSQVVASVAWFNRDVAQLPEPPPDVGIYLLDTATGELVRHIRGPRCPPTGLFQSGYFLDTSRPLGAATPSADDCSVDNTVDLWLIDLTSGETTVAYDQPVFGWDYGASASLSDDGRYLAFCRGTLATVVDLETGAEVIEKPGGWYASLTGDGSRLLSAEERTVTLWDIASQTAIWRIDAPLTLNDVRFNDDGTFVVAGAHDGGVRVWDAESGEALHELRGWLSYSWIISMTDDHTLIANASGNAMRVWDLTPNAESELAGFDLPGASVLQGGRIVDERGAILRYPDAESALQQPGTAMVIDVASNRIAAQFPDTYGGHLVRLSPDEQLLAGQPFVAPGLLGPVHIRDVATGEVLVELEDLCTFDITTKSPGADCAELPNGYADQISSIDFSPDGSMIAIGGADLGIVGVWDVDTGRRIALLDLPGLRGADQAFVQFSPASDLLLAVTTELHIYSTDDWSQVATFPLEWMIMDAQFTRTGQYLVVARGAEGAIITVDTNTWDQVGPALVGHEGSTRDLDLNSDGSVVASGGADGKVQIWNRETGELLQSIPVGSSVTLVDFITDQHLLIIPDEGPARVMTIDTSELIDIARSRITRGLTADECSTYHIDPCPDLETIRGG